ncbi:MAG TPA: tetratricopeptide repeat protein [Terriglobales bacterium]|nr:tetratricopeptide repeat protein [Terriglobales bacterium]
MLDSIFDFFSQERTLRSTQRHQLKEDQFAHTVTEQLQWAAEHRKPLVYGAVIAAVLVVVLLAGWYYMQSEEQQAALALSGALRTYNASLRPADSPPSPEQESYPSAAERAKAAIPKLRQVADKYPSVASGRLARYFLGLSLMEAGDNSGAEAQLQRVAGSGDKNLASLARMALAALYRQTGRDPQAIQIYKELVEKPTDTVAKPAAQLELASLYATKDSGEARKLYEQVRLDNPNSAAASIATSKLAELK